MKRDMDLVRKILLALEAHPHGCVPVDCTITGYDEMVIHYHVWLMEQGGLLAGVQHGAGVVAWPVWITPKGRTFLDAVRSDTVWAKVNAVMKDEGLPFPLLQQLALKI